MDKLLSKISEILCFKNLNISIKQERVRPKNSEVNRLQCDNSKIIQNTEWKPKYHLEEG